MDEDFILDDEFLDGLDEINDICLPPCKNNVIENFPFLEDDFDSLTDYELFSKGFGYLDDNKADKKDIPDVSDFITKDVDDLTNYYDKDTTDDLLDTKADVSDIPDVSNFITKDVDDLTYYTKTSDLATVATTGDYDDLLDKPTIPDVSNFITKDVNDLTYYTKTSDLATVATTGDYDDLLDKPTIPDVSNFITKDVDDLTYYTKTSDLATVATTGDYDDLLDKPTIPDVSNFITKDVNDLTYYTKTSDLTTLLNGKENAIVSGSNTNGYYMKFDDGTLIQWNKITVQDQSISGTYGSLYLGSRAITFPIAFYSTDDMTVVCTRFHWGTSASWGSVSSFTTTGASLYGYDIASRATGTNCNIDWIAIGKWK